MRDTIPKVSFKMLRPDRRVDNFHDDTVIIMIGYAESGRELYQGGQSPSPARRMKKKLQISPMPSPGAAGEIRRSMAGKRSRP